MAAPLSLLESGADANAIVSVNFVPELNASAAIGVLKRHPARPDAYLLEPLGIGQPRTFEADDVEEVIFE